MPQSRDKSRKQRPSGRAGGEALPAAREGASIASGAGQRLGEAAGSGPPGLLKTLGVVLSLSLVAALQLAMTWGKLDDPFLDGRFHYNNDNACFTVAARNGNRVGDLRRQFGVYFCYYDSWGHRTTEGYNYINHPPLMKALFQQYTKLVGYEEWASRSFYLLVAFGIAAGLFAVLLQTTRSLGIALLATAVMVNIPLFATFQTCVKWEADGMLIGVWLFAALVRYLRRSSRPALVAVFLLTFLAFLTHWSVMPFAAAVAAYLLWRSRDRTEPEARRALLAVVGGGTLGLGALAALLLFLNGGSAELFAKLLDAGVARAGEPRGTSHAWWPRQWVYAESNFGVALLLAVLGLTVFFSARWVLRRRKGTRPSDAPGHDPNTLLWVFFFASLTAACCWLFIFTQAAFIHVYWQIWFVLPIATLIAAFLHTARPRRNLGQASFVVCFLLAVLLSGASVRAYDELLASQLGRPDDIEFLETFRHERFSRLVFIPVSDDPFNYWFKGFIFSYYTDRRLYLYKPGKRERVATDDKVLLLRSPQQDEVVSRLESRIGKRLVNQTCGPHFCAYDVILED